MRWLRLIPYQKFVVIGALLAPGGILRNRTIFGLPVRRQTSFTLREVGVRTAG